MFPNTLTIILGGGQGTRLSPLTEERAKPAVPFGGKYRLIDIALSNSLNSGFRNIYVLTQFNSASLNSHVFRSYRLDSHSGGFVEVLAAQQRTKDSEGWFKGTADAVRKHLGRYKEHNPDYYMVLSGDQLYTMDLADFLRKHINSKADISIATTPVSRKEADELGILKVDKSSVVTNFLEKPGADKDISEMKITQSFKKRNPSIPDNKDYFASMGIYIFNRNALEECLAEGVNDFGKEIIPNAIERGSYKMNGYVFCDYWEDIGTIPHFFHATIDLAKITPKFNLYNAKMPILPNVASLPPSKINTCTFSQSMACEGSILTCQKVSDSVIGPRSIIENEAILENVYMMGAGYYETDEEKSQNKKIGRPNIGVGRHSIIKRAIIDKNVRIGEGCRIGVNDITEDGDYDRYKIRDGIIVVTKGAVFEDGEVI